MRDIQLRFRSATIHFPHGVMFGENLDAVLTQWKAFKQWRRDITGQGRQQTLVGLVEKEDRQ